MVAAAEVDVIGLDPVDELEASALRRYTRWDAALWRAVIDGPARDLSEALVAGGGERGAHEALVRSFLALAAEGIGRGYIVPSAAIGADTFLSRAFLRWLPVTLPRAEAARRAEVLAEVWNLGENLEGEAPWLHRVVLAAAERNAAIDQLPTLLSQVERALSGVDDPPLGRDTAVIRTLIDVAPDDRAFLPGRVLWVTPVIACVVDRTRDGRDGRPCAARGLWLTRPVTLLGPMWPPETPLRTLPVKDDLWASLAAPDVRLTGRHAAVRVASALVASLETSRYVAVFQGGGS